MPPTPIGKPVPNRRGRKPLTTPPINKKHKQNLNNQRAFRQRRDAYVKGLEIKVKDFEDQIKELELLCAQVQNENRSLREKVASLEKRRNEENDLCDGGLSISSTDIQLANKISGNKDATGTSMYSVQDIMETTQMGENQIYQEIHKDDSSCDVVMSDASTARQFVRDSPSYQQCLSSTSPKHYTTLLPLENISYQSRGLPSYLSSFDFNKEKYTHQRHQSRSDSNSSSSSSISAEDIINPPLFCEKDGDICFCEPPVTVDDFDLNSARTQTQIPNNNGRYLVTQKTGKRICMILPPRHIMPQSPSTSSSLYPPFSDCEDLTRNTRVCPSLPLPESQWNLTQNEHYLSSASAMSFPTSPFSQSHPPQLKWLLESKDRSCESEN
ncbi:884_t:CDS:2 [Acaulospora morrowiae]|uniref:884_t:CDS:1 n=1 Tax=Acaulospora morrowiae TaxID=94023 RepID=A0A9N9D7P9_9GLOM|nr:884_t:CDS:2 [Acaulospora morrowiae]